MSAHSYLNPTELVRALDEALPEFDLVVEPAPDGSGDADVFFVRAGGERSPWSLAVWVDNDEFMFNFGKGSLRMELESTEESVELCARTVLATHTGHFKHTTSRWRDRIDVRFPDGTELRLRTSPGSERRP